MPKKKKKNLTWLWVLLGVIIIGGLLWYGTSQGLFANLNIPQMFLPKFNFDQLPRPDSYINENPDYEIKLELMPPAICVGDQTTGIITSNMPRAYCRIFVSINNGPWQPLSDIQLDANGNYRQTETILNTGRARFVTICCDTEFECRVSNFANLVVDTCDSTPPTDDTPQVGDILDSGGNSGTHPAGASGSIWGIYPNVEYGGDCYLGIRINTQLSHVEGSQCETDVNINFHGSYEPWRLLKRVTVPSSNSFDICPVYWDGTAPLAIQFEPTNLDCSFNYIYAYEIYICNCP